MIIGELAGDFGVKEMHENVERMFETCAQKRKPQEGVEAEVEDRSCTKSAKD